MILSVTILFGCKPKDSDVQGDDVSDETPKETVELLVSAAASLTDVMGELADAYKTEAPEIDLNFTFGSSGALQAQIEEGAPVDVFMSAAQKQMEALKTANLMLDDTIKTLLVNKVVLIIPKDSDLKISSFEDLGNADVKKLAIGDPGNVPVGQYSEEIFKNLDLKDKVKPKLVLGNDVRSVLTWVENGEVDCGIVYATDAFTTDNVTIVTEAPEGSHKEVTYPVGVVKDSKHSAESKAFLD
ncbi:MAG: molybdate ABC transporter substrate-binding protein, partial [Clostridiales bacterium]|nr:molybdate ABC transporter substrate-binding protein [Clostridiales bacterium]